MQRVIIMSGLPGSGKTWKRENTPALAGLAHLDIADVYTSLPHSSWSEVMSAFIVSLHKLLRESDTVVVEGLFLAESTTRAWLLREIRSIGAVVEEFYMNTPVETCRERVLLQNNSRQGVRLRLLDKLGGA